MGFEPLGLAIEPFQGLERVQWVQESVQECLGPILAQALQPQGSAIPFLVAASLALGFLLGA